MDKDIEKKILAIEEEHGGSVIGNLLGLQALGEVMPTPEEFESHTLTDFSEPDNVRKLARIIAQRNPMESAADLTAEISYAYQHAAYDCASGARSLLGIAPVSGLQELLTLLETSELSSDTDIPKEILIGMLQDAIRIEGGQDE